MDIKIFSKKEDFESGSVALINMKTNHGKVKSTVNDRFYYIIEGDGIFIIDNKESKVEKGDLIVIPKNTEYDFSGKIQLLLVHVPAFISE